MCYKVETICTFKSFNILQVSKTTFDEDYPLPK
jgi:hypothetical protein